MTFFEHQDRARQNTQRLIGLFVLSIISIICIIYGVAIVTLGVIPSHSSPLDPASTPTSVTLWHPNLFLIVAIATTSVIGGGSWFKIMQLKQGGKIIAQDLGGRRLTPEMADAAEKQLLNVVEEMAIAASIPVPAVYILDREHGINAFAAGSTPKDAVIGVTKGTLEQLNRDELQGVIGHEFSHILNGDMRINLKLVGLLNGILLIYLIGRVLFSWNRHSSRDEKNNGLMWFGLALIVIGSVGVVWGRLIQSAVSRQREFLADASAVQFTRNPAGIAEALRKIAGYRHSSLIHSPYAEANSHLFFGTALRFNFLADLFATHPPLNQRIRRLDAYAGRYASQTATRSAAIAPSAATNVLGIDVGNEMRDLGSEMVLGFAAGSATSAAALGHSKTVARTVPTSQGWMAELPESVQVGLQDAAAAIAIVYALALDAENPSLREQQILWLKHTESADVVQKTIQFQQDLQTFDPKLRLPLLDLTVPLLKRRSLPECQELFKRLNGLAKVDNRWSLPEFVLYISLWYRLQSHLKPTIESPTLHTTLDPIWTDCVLILSAIAQVGQTQPDAIAYAFRSGVGRLPGAAQRTLPEKPISCNFGDLRKSLDRIATATPKLKQTVVDACSYTVFLDNTVTVQEADLLWAVAIALNCPFPPFLKPTPRSKKTTSL